ncbi:MAG: hypothetical protein ACJAQ6_001406 [Arenicella sp.]|jgi:hypothetical protein
MVDKLYINDNNLVLESAGQRLVSQGYAWLKGDQVLFDLGDSDSPVSQCRLAPQQINSRYWQQCEQSAIPANEAGMRHAADLIWQHLSQLQQRKNLTEVVLVVPSHYRESNLQLLLGIAKACKLEVKGMVNKAVVALHNRVQAGGEYWHFDVQLHQTVCSRVSVENGLVTLGEIEILSDVGIHLMQEALLKGLQNNFIQNDRFDPLHDAATEQQLFDQLPNIAMQLAQSGKASVGLEHQSRLHNTTLDSKEWQALLTPFSDRLIDLGRSADASYLDLNAAFKSTGLDLLTKAGFVDLHEIADFSLSHAAQVSESGRVIYRTDLPISKSTADTINRSAVEQNLADKDPVNKVVTSPASADTSTGQVDMVSQQATHLLCGGNAIAMVNAQLTIDNGLLGLRQNSSGNVQEMLTSGRVYILNGEGRTQLKANDRIASNLVDGVVTVITVIQVL